MGGKENRKISFHCGHGGVEVEFGTNRCAIIFSCIFSGILDKSFKTNKNLILWRLKKQNFDFNFLQFFIIICYYPAVQM